jgi:SAM-dependent methyltransferase
VKEMIFAVDDRTKAIKAFWDQRGATYGGKEQATLGESDLRKLEIRAMSGMMRVLKPGSVLDAGCGNGYSTKTLASAFPSSEFIGMDYSEPMIAAARLETPKNCAFLLGDVLLEETYPAGRFDCVMTQRCIQNLPTYDHQRKAITCMLGKLAPGGYLLLMECSHDGVHQLNRVRGILGKENLLDIEPWHNCFLSDKSLIDDFGARVVSFASTYMFLSKVVSSRLSRVATLLPSIGRFGYDRLYIITPSHAM